MRWARKVQFGIPADGEEGLGRRDAFGMMLERLREIKDGWETADEETG